MKTFKVTITRILTNYPAKVFTVKAHNIVLAQIRVWRKVKIWHHVTAAEEVQSMQGVHAAEPVPPGWDKAAGETSAGE